MNYVNPLGVIGEPAQQQGSLDLRRTWPISYHSIGRLALICDVALILGCGVGSGTLYNLTFFGGPGDILGEFGAAIVVAAFYVSVMKSQGLYSASELLSLRTQIGNVTTTWLGVLLFLSGAVFALKIGDHFSRGATFSFVATGLAGLLVERIILYYFLRRGISERRFSGRKAVLISDAHPAPGDDLLATLLRHGVRLHHQFTLPAPQTDLKLQDDAVSKIVSYCRDSDIEEVIVSVDVKRWSDLTKLFSGLRRLPLPVNLFPVGPASDLLRRPVHAVGESVYIELQREPLGGFERLLKRSIDIFGALASLVLLAPLLIITSVMIKLDSPGPILFRQRRRGFNGREFNIYKFRTMTVQEDGLSITQATEADYRVTRLGKWLRPTSIDELPQLLNVLSGDMSLVGPRPHAVAHDNHFDTVVRNYAFRHHVRPGLTGWAQVNGYRGPTPTLVDIRRRVEFDLWYIDNWSLRLDLWILLRTTLEIMRARNAY